MSNLDFLLPTPTVPADVFRFGVITAIQPLRVKLDGDAAQTEVTPIVVNETGGVGSRVLVQIHNRQLLIAGRVGGAVKILGATENLNDKEYTGFFHQPLSVNAANGTNYPNTLAGMMEVVRGSTGGQIFQQYTAYLSTSRYIRSRYNGTWNGWKRVIAEDDAGKASVQRLRVTSTDDATNSSTTHGFQIGPDDGYRVVMDTNEMLIMSSGSTWGNYFIHGLQVSIQGEATGSNFGPYLQDLTGGGKAGMKVSGTASYFQVDNMWTTTSAATCYVNTAGTLYRSTSIRAAKVAIEDIPEQTLDALENIRVRTWYDRGDAERLAADIENGTTDISQPGPLKRIPGVIAEELEELGLEMFLLRGEEGALEGVAYDRMGAAAIRLIRRQAERIDKLEKRLDKLDGSGE